MEDLALTPEFRATSIGINTVPHASAASQLYRPQQTTKIFRISASTSPFFQEITALRPKVEQNMGLGIQY